MRRRADVVFRLAKVALFIDGCFWHGCPLHASRAVKSNADYWQSKLERNKARGLDTDARLAEAGWSSVRAWEHESPADIAGRAIEQVLRRRRVEPPQERLTAGGGNGLPPVGGR